MIRFIIADIKHMWAGALIMVALIALSIAVGVGVVLSERMVRVSTARAADKFDLIIGGAGSPTQLALTSVFLQPAALPLISGEVLDDLSHDERVMFTAPIGMGDYYQDHPIIGTTQILVDHLYPGFETGAIFANNHQAIIGADVALEIGETIIPMHGLADQGGHHHDDIHYQIVGRLQASHTAWDRAIIVPIEAVWQVHGMGEGHHHDHGDHAHDTHAHVGLAEDGHIHAKDDHAHEAHVENPQTPPVPAILVKPKTFGDAYTLRQDYRTDSLQAIFPAEVLTSLYATLGDVRVILGLIAGGTEILVGVALLFAALIHIQQRKSQIGALRAFGASRSVVLLLIWMELFVLFLVGIILGHVVAHICMQILAHNVSIKSSVPMMVEWQIEDIAHAMIFIMIAAVICLLPAAFAWRISPIRAMRSTV